jgi:hypothetical protein
MTNLIPNNAVINDKDGNNTPHPKLHLLLLTIIEYYFVNNYYDEALQGK